MLIRRNEGIDWFTNDQLLQIWQKIPKGSTIYDQYKVPNYYSKRWSKCKHSHLKSITTDGQPNLSRKLCHNIFSYFLDIWIGSLWQTFLVHTPVLGIILGIKLCLNSEYSRISKNWAGIGFQPISLMVTFHEFFSDTEIILCQQA